jgi:hypothetical protein
LRITALRAFAQTHKNHCDRNHGSNLEYKQRHLKIPKINLLALVAQLTEP